MHRTMAAGLASGIGLCGGACGALGVTFCIYGLKRLSAEGGTIDYKDAGADVLIETFMKCTDYEFECSRIAGRKFGAVNDHADYVRNDG